MISSYLLFLVISMFLLQGTCMMRRRSDGHQSQEQQEVSTRLLEIVNFVKTKEERKNVPFSSGQFAAVIDAEAGFLLTPLRFRTGADKNPPMLRHRTELFNIELKRQIGPLSLIYAPAIKNIKYLGAYQLLPVKPRVGLAVSFCQIGHGDSLLIANEVNRELCNADTPSIFNQLMLERSNLGPKRLSGSPVNTFGKNQPSNSAKNNAESVPISSSSSNYWPDEGTSGPRSSVAAVGGSSRASSTKLQPRCLEALDMGGSDFSSATVMGYEGSEVTDNTGTGLVGFVKRGFFKPRDRFKNTQEALFLVDVVNNEDVQAQITLFTSVQPLP